MTVRLRVCLAMFSSAMFLQIQPALAQTPAPSGASTPPSAQAPASSSTDLAQMRIVSDPLFLPLQGQVYGTTGYTLNMPKGDNFKAGVNTGAFTASDSLIGQTIAYGILNALTVRVSFGYGMNNRDSTAEATGDVTTGNASGPSDPTISATYRILDEPRTPLVFDVTGSYSPNAFSAEAAGGTSNGTIARGGQNTGLAFAVGRVTHTFTVAGTMSTTYVGQQTTELLSNESSSIADSHWNYDAGLTTQARLSDRASINIGFDVGNAATYNVSNVQSGKAHTFAGPITRTVSLAFNYHVAPNVVAAFTYSYNNLTTSTNTFANPASDTAVENRMGNVVGVLFLYAFN